MEDFGKFSEGRKEKDGKKEGSKESLYETVTKIAKSFDGKGKGDLLKAIYKEAERSKRAGTLTNAEIDNFVVMLSPALDEKGRKYLYKIAEELKKI